MDKKKGVNLLIASLVILSIAFCSIIWKSINLNFSNITQAKGAITQLEYSTDADTLRYIIFITVPLLTFLLSYFLLKKEKTRKIPELFIFPKIEKNINYKIFIPSTFFLIFIVLEFLSLKLPSGPIDTFHDGELFSVTKNSLLLNSFFKDTYTIHGFSDIFYPMFLWRITGFETIGSGRLFFLFLILIIKILSLILSYKIIKFSSVKNKEIFYFLFTLILLTFSEYQVPINFSLFSYRDIYIIIFLIFFSSIFLSNQKSKIINFFLGAIPTFAFIMHIDTGAFLYILLFSLLIYFLINKRIRDISEIIFSILISWGILFLLFGGEELKNFLNNAITIILSMDYLHGIKYPEPFFSINDNKDGMRATRGLLLQLTACLFVFYHLINKKSEITNGGKIFFVFLFFLSFIMYKNALGRSDSYHIRMSNDLPILINSYFIIHFLIKKIEEKFYSFKISPKITIVSFSIILMTLYYHKINMINILNLNNNYSQFIKLQNNNFIDENKKKFIVNFKKISISDKCFQNFTDDLILLYLIEKPSCTKFIASWLASPNHLQKEYIKSLEKTKPNFIVYNSLYFKVDGVPMSERLSDVNKFILKNYEFYENLNSYDILKIKN